MATLLKASLISAVVALALPAVASAAPEIRTVSGATPAALDATINAFKADAGDRRSRDQLGRRAGERHVPEPLPGRVLRQPARRGVRHARHRHRDLQRLAVGRRLLELFRRQAVLAGRLQLHQRALQRARHAAPGVHRARSASCSRTSTPRAAPAVTFLDSRGATILDVAGARRPERAAASWACASATASASPRSRSAPARRRSRPASSTRPQTDLAAIDDVLFAEPQADLAPPPDIQFVPIDVPTGSSRPSMTSSSSATPALRASLITLAKSVAPRPHC